MIDKIVQKLKNAKLNKQCDDLEDQLIKVKEKQPV